MRFCLFIFLILAIMKRTLQNCRLMDIEDPPSRIYVEYPRPIKRYAHCQSLKLSADFHKNVDLLNISVTIEWLLINNTNSPEIASGAFKTLQKLPDLRINEANVQAIQPGAFDGLLNLTQLSLKSNKIYDLKANTFNVSHLLTLDLSFNIIAYVDRKSFAGLKQLKRLILHNNFIDELAPEVFAEIISLEYLDLSFNKITHIDNSLFTKLSNLKSLLLNNNNLDDFQTDLISNNFKLTALYINNNFLTTLSNLSFPESILLLNASYNSIHSLHFLSHTNIQIVDLHANAFMTLKKKFFKNLAVKDLYLDQNYFGMLNSIEITTFNNLSSMELISLSNNQIRHLNPNLFQNNNQLKIVNLSKNYLNSLPKLPNSLVYLNISSNNFNSSLNLTTFTNLNVLDLGSNNISEISYDFLHGLTMLNVLNLQNNGINKISIGSFRDLKKLLKLNLSNNNISNLDIGVFVGTDFLTNLDISHNKLKEINEGTFHNLVMLRSLNLGYNKISFFNLKKTLAHYFSFTEIGLAGNNWSCSLLTSIRSEYRRIRFIHGDNYNVTNVDGVACKYGNYEDDNSKSEDYVGVMASKLDTNNNLLIIILSVLILQLILKYILLFVKRNRLMLAKDEEEMQLV